MRLTRRNSSKALKNGDATAIGCTAEQMSWKCPGCISSLVRVPPPMLGPASKSSTDNPARAITTAAASPLGPAPTTTTSGIGPCFPWEEGTGGSAGDQPEPVGRAREGTAVGIINV